MRVWDSELVLARKNVEPITSRVQDIQFGATVTSNTKIRLRSSERGARAVCKIRPNNQGFHAHWSGGRAIWDTRNLLTTTCRSACHKNVPCLQYCVVMQAYM